eukprot:6378110-Alexandrium_andersonii.AAC.1
MAPTLRQRSPGHRPHLTDLRRANRHDAGNGAPAPAEPNPRLPAGVQAAVHIGRPHPVAHEFPELAPVLTGSLSEEALDARAAVVADQ